MQSRLVAMCKCLMYYMYIVINFCEITYTKLYSQLDKTVNSCLEGYVLYYGLYGKDEKFYATLYDNTSLFKRVFILFKQATYMKCDLFQYKDVVNNIDELSQFFVDCAIISYVSNGKIVHQIVTHEQDNEIQFDDMNFVYAVAKLEGENQYIELTNIFNTYKDGILRCRKLAVNDLVRIAGKLLKKDIELGEGTLDIMTDNTFTEFVFKNNDVIYDKFKNHSKE